VVAGAPAEVALDSQPDVGLGGVRLFLQQ
jgi:hypothetical protein